MSRVVSWLVTALVAYAMIVLLLWLLQDRMLFLPARIDPAHLDVEAARLGLEPWRPDGRYRGLVTRTGGERGTVVVLQGNAGWAGDRAWYAEALVPLGFRVVLAEYPGYGARGGRAKPRVVFEDTAETLRHVRARMKSDDAPPWPAPLIVLGESLGAGVVAQVLRDAPDLADGLLLVTPWDSLANVGQHHYFWLPVRWLLRAPMDSAAALAGWPGPLVVAVAERDEIVPARFGESLAAALDARLVVVPGARHNDWPLRLDAGFWPRVLAPLVESRR